MGLSILSTRLLPTSDVLRDVSQLRSGDLAEVSFGVLLRALWEYERTVVVDLSHNGVEKTIVFEEGTPVDCDSNLAHERLGRFLVEQGKLSEAVFTNALSESIKDGVALGQVLVRRNLVPPSELYRLLQQNLAHKLLSCFAMGAGSFAIATDLPEVDSPLRVRVPQLILTGLARFASQEQIDMVVMSLVGRKIALNPRPPVEREELRLLPSQQKLLFYLEQRPRELSELAAASKLSVSELSRLLYAFGVLGLLGAENEIENLRSVRSVNTQKVAVEAGALLDPEELSRRHLAYRKADPSTLLEVLPSAGAQQVQKAYLAWAERLRPWSYPHEDGLKERATDLFLAATRAFVQLHAERLREVGRDTRPGAPHDTLPAGQMPPLPVVRRSPPPAAPQNKIRTDLLDPEVQFRKGMSLVEAGKVREALQYLSFAADCDPQNGNYRAEHAYQRYLGIPAEYEVSLRQLAEARRIDPRCGRACLYAGLILSDHKRWDESEQMLQSAIKLMAPDRRPIDALREVGRLRKVKAK